MSRPPAPSHPAPTAEGQRTPTAESQRTRSGTRPRHRSRDRGQVVIEYVGLLPILLFVALCAVQLGLAVYAVQQAGTAARAAARVASQAHTTADYQSAGEAAVSDWLDPTFDAPQYGYDSVEVTAHVDIPSVVPGVGFGTANRSVTMPRD